MSLRDLNYFNSQTISNNISIINCNFYNISNTALIINSINYICLTNCFFFNCISSNSGAISSNSLIFICEKTCFLFCYETTNTYGSAIYTISNNYSLINLISADKCHRPSNSYYSVIMLRYGDQISNNCNFSNNKFNHNAGLHHWQGISSKISFYSSSLNSGLYFIGFDNTVNNNLIHNKINIFNNLIIDALTCVQHITSQVENSFFISNSGQMNYNYNTGGILKMINCYFFNNIILNNCITNNCSYWNTNIQLNEFYLLNPYNCKEFFFTFQNIKKLKLLIYLTSQIEMFIL